MKIYSDKVSRTLADKQMSRSALASAAGLTRSQISVILKRGTATELTVGKIAAGLGVPVEEIMIREGPS